AGRDDRPARLEHRRAVRDEPAGYGVARRAARPVGAEGGETPVRVEVVEMNASLVSSGNKERPVCADRKTATAKQRDPTAVRVREASPIRLEEEEVVSPSRHLHEPRRQRHTWILEWLGGCFGAPRAGIAPGGPRPGPVAVRGF